MTQRPRVPHHLHDKRDALRGWLSLQMHGQAAFNINHFVLCVLDASVNVYLNVALVLIGMEPVLTRV